MGICNSNDFLNKKQKVNECDTKHAALIPESSSDIIYNSIVKINVNNGLEGTGFFMKFKINDKQINCLLTCNHLINNNNINSKDIIEIYYGKINQVTIKRIILDKNKRLIKTFEPPIDITLIEIIKTDKVPDDKYLFPDYNYKNGYEFYNDNNFYMAGYPKIIGNKAERAICSGKIINIDKFEFEHNLDSRKCSSGSPICLIENKNVIGIHKQGDLAKAINYGTFIGVILDYFEKNKTKKDNNIYSEKIKIKEEHDFHFNNIVKECQIICKEIIQNVCILDDKNISNNKFIIVKSKNEINIYFLESKKLKLRIELIQLKNKDYFMNIQGYEINVYENYYFRTQKVDKLEIVDSKYYEKPTANTFLLITTGYKIEINLGKNKVKYLQTLDTVYEYFKKKFPNKIFMYSQFISNLDIIVEAYDKQSHPDWHHSIFFFDKNFHLLKKYDNLFGVDKTFDVNGKFFITYVYIRDCTNSKVFDMNNNYVEVYKKEGYHYNNLTIIDNNKILILPPSYENSFTFFNLENFSVKSYCGNFNLGSMIIHKFKGKKYLHSDTEYGGCDFGKKLKFSIIEEKNEGYFTTIEELNNNEILGDNLIFFDYNSIITWNYEENIIKFLKY